MAFEDPSGLPLSVHVVDAMTGSDRVLVYGPWWPLDFAPNGLYLALAEQVPQEEGGGLSVRPRGLYFLPLGGRTPIKLSDLDLVNFNLGAGSGWSLVLGPAPLYPNRLVRFDVRTGAVEDWLAIASPYVGLSNLVVDGTGYPVVVRFIAGGGFDLLSVRTAGTAVTLFHSDSDRPSPQGPFAVNEYGLWLTTFGDEPFTSSPWFVRSDGRLFQLPSVAPRSVEVDGGCL